jgi:hypothetical protein
MAHSTAVGWRHALASIATVTAAITAALLVCEAIARLVDGVPLTSADNFVGRELDGVHGTSGYAVYDSQVGWITRPNSAFVLNGASRTFGQYGARMSSGEVVPLRQGAVLMVGDSFGAGAEGNDADSWPAQIERMIGTQVINAGVGGYGFDQIVLRAEELVPRLKPRMLLIQTRLEYGLSVSRMSINGGAPKPYFTARDGQLVLNNVPVPQTATSNEIGLWRSILGYSYLVHSGMRRLDLLQWWVSPAMAIKLVQSTPEASEVACLLMRRLSGLRDRLNIPVSLVFQYAGTDAIVSALAWEEDRARVTACAEQQKLEVFDGLEPLRSIYQTDGLQAYQELWVMHDNNRLYGHMSAEGNRMIARLIYARFFANRFPVISNADGRATSPQ